LNFGNGSRIEVARGFRRRCPERKAMAGARRHREIPFLVGGGQSDRGRAGQVCQARRGSQDRETTADRPCKLGPELPDQACLAAIEVPDLWVGKGDLHACPDFVSQRVTTKLPLCKFAITRPVGGLDFPFAQPNARAKGNAPIASDNLGWANLVDLSPQKSSSADPGLVDVDNLEIVYERD
jgi:hypothetical protein